MINWFTSLRGAITLSSIAMLSFIGYVFLEAYFFLGQWISGIPAAAGMTFVVIAIVGGWIWGLLAAVGGSRGGLIAMLIFGSLPIIITLYDLILYSPIPYGWPLLQIAVWTTFVLCLIAAIAIALQLR
jgi:hypothetical protein